MAQYKGVASKVGQVLQLMKKWKQQQEHMEQLRQRIAEENIMKSNIDKKFSAHYDAIEAELKSSTVGLVTLNDMKAKQEALVKEREKQLVKREQSRELQLKLERQWEQEAKRKICSLSFSLEEAEEEGGLRKMTPTARPPRSPPRSGNWGRTLLFLPDRNREEEENRPREQLCQEWEAKQEKIKNDEIEITFSYWDGSGHWHMVKMKKGKHNLTVPAESTGNPAEGLQRAAVCGGGAADIHQGGSDHPPPPQLLQLHHHQSWGKSRPLFNFNVHNYVRLLSDATMEKDESHTGKVVLRSWYEKNKHIFPTSRWEPYDPEKWDKYMI
ncbi:hypothetical protein QYF61_005847 [Mycteria americana]|uniref:FAM50A/XAP5 C-terminal domain-containing protein n=1 Tax=Mycteria americana TaxID=33587 RepID=A0AAN7SH35_MYCAM|nr:hypothetical protein QYF61_005847 [Mycteria americana]